jgi:pimeloyl-ACP methyl ester carboxylesterase
MRRDSRSIGLEANELELYFLAGLATAPLFMEKLQLELLAAMTDGRHIGSQLLFPYGDWSRTVFPQLREIRSDMRLRPERVSKSIGGNRALEAIRRQRALSPIRTANTTTILIGHSGGGVAAVHAGQLLLEQGLSSACLVVMVGSPRCRIPHSLRPNTLSIHVAGRRGKRSLAKRKSPDLVSRLGTHGGWTIRSASMNGETEVRRRFPFWHRDKHAPSTVVAVPIIGGHADYFRERAPYVDPNGQSNLDVTMDAILGWLSRRNQPSE